MPSPESNFGNCEMTWMIAAGSIVDGAAEAAVPDTDMLGGYACFKSGMIRQPVVVGRLIYRYCRLVAQVALFHLKFGWLIGLGL